MKLQLDLKRYPEKTLKMSRKYLQPSDYLSMERKEDYIKLPDANFAIARTETYREINQQNAIYALQEVGLFMPNLSQFIAHYLNVRHAAQGEVTLCTADNRPVPRDEAEELWRTLSTRCWTHLDARFERGSGFNNLDLLTDSRVIDKKARTHPLSGNYPVIPKNYPLEACIMEDCYVELNFNSQGLPTQKSAFNQSRQGENIWYWPPRTGEVANFQAFSTGVVLCCRVDPKFSFPALRVFPCAEVAPK